MRGLTFSDSLVFAACLHGLTFFMLSPPSQRPDAPPPPSMLHIKLGTNFGNATSAPPTAKKTVIAAIPNHFPDVPAVKTPDVKPEWVKQEKVELKQPAIVTKTEAPKQEVKNLKQPLSLPEPAASPVKPAPLPTPPVQKVTPVPQEPKPVIQAALIQQASAMGSPIGNSNEADAGHIMRYEQLLAVWLHKFKQYPTEARMKNQEGTAILHIVIDRTGNVLRSDLSAKTGYPLLDEAVMEMVTQAKTVPPVPDDYPGDSELEFQIPVKFTLESL